MSAILTSKFWTDNLRSLFTVSRLFPREVALAFITMVALMVQVESTDEVARIALHIGLSAILVMNLSLATTLVVRSQRLGGLWGWSFLTVAAGALSWFVFLLDFDNTVDIVQYAYLVVLVHMLVVLSWTALGSVEKFWTAVIAMFHRILFAALFTSVLQMGLTLVLASVRLLFGLEGLSHLEVHVSFFVYFMFNTMFFLSGLPSDSELDGQSKIDNMTSVFVRFVLAPLILLFVVILWAYSAKLIYGGLTEEVTYYVLLLTGFTTLAILLTWPERDAPGFPWRILHQYTMATLIPLLGVATWAWTIYLGSNGIDEFGFTIAALLLVSILVVLSSVFRRGLDPRIPAAAFVIVLCFTTAGPLGVSAVSAGSSGSDTTDGKQDTSMSKVQDNVDSVRTSMPARFVLSYNSGGTWSTSFALSDVEDTEVVRATSPDNTTEVSFPRLSTLVTLINNVQGDTVVFDALNLLAEASDTLRVIEQTSNAMRTLVMATDATLVRRNGQWTISRIAATTFSTKLKNSK